MRFAHFEASAAWLSIWAVVLVGLVTFRRTAAPDSDSVQRDSLSVSLQAIRITDSLPVDLTADTSSLGVVFVSASCSVCRDYREEIVEALQSIRAGGHAVIAVRSADAPRLRVFGYPDSLLYILSDAKSIAPIRVSEVPTFFLFEQRTPSLIWIGVPNQVQIWMASLKGLFNGGDPEAPSEREVGVSHERE